MISNLKSILHPVTGSRLFRGFLLLILMSSATGSSAAEIINLQDTVTVCEARPSVQWPVNFNEAYCQKMPLMDVDPQKNELWVEIPIALTEEQLASLPPPLALFLFAKASSEAYLNEALLGSNGRPGNSDNEIQGAMDSYFFIPPGLLKIGENKLVLHLSAQKSWLDLARPIHLISIGTFSDPRQYVQQYSELGLVLLGVLITGFVYFLFKSLTPSQRSNNILLVLMCLCASVQLFSEMSRGIVGYQYPLHDLRLIVVTFMSSGFGLCLLILIAKQFARRGALHWIYAGVILTVGSMLMVSSFDLRTIAGTFIPAIIATVISALFWWRFRSRQAGVSTIVLVFFIVLNIVAADYFHEIVYFIFVSLLLAFLFIQQALESNDLFAQQKQDKETIGKLRFRLEQTVQQSSPSVLTLKSVGKVDKINTADIAYCQAAKDFSEIHLLNGRQLLYSGTLKSLEAELPSTFLRVHRSYMVNLEQVQRLSTSTPESSNGSLILSNNKQVPVSRRLVPAVRSAVADSPESSA